MSYDDAQGDAISKVRFEIGDAIESAEELPDAFIEGVLLGAGNNILLTAERCAWHLYTRFAQQVDQSQAGPDSVRTQTHHQARARTFRAIFEEIRRRRTSKLSAPVALGSDADLQSTLSDRSLPTPTFYPGRFDNPQAGDGDC